MTTSVFMFGLPVLERTPRPPVEPPPSPELHRRREEKQPEVEPPHRDREHKPSIIGRLPTRMSAVSAAARRKSALELSVLALVGVLDGGAPPPAPHRSPRPRRPSPRSRGSTSPARYSTVAFSLARFTLASRTPGTFSRARLDPPHAARARHARHAEGRLAHVRAVARVPYGPDQLVRARGRRDRRSRSPSRRRSSRSPRQHPPSSESVRSTRRTQEAQVIPVTGMVIRVSCSFSLVVCMLGFPPSRSFESTLCYTPLPYMSR